MNVIGMSRCFQSTKIYIRDRGFKSLWNFEKSVQSLLPLEPYGPLFRGEDHHRKRTHMFTNPQTRKMLYTYFGRPSSLKLGSVIRPLLEGEE